MKDRILLITEPTIWPNHAPDIILKNCFVETLQFKHTILEDEAFPPKIVVEMIIETGEKIDIVFNTGELYQKQFHRFEVNLEIKSMKVLAVTNQNDYSLYIKYKIKEFETIKSFKVKSKKIKFIKV